MIAGLGLLLTGGCVHAPQPRLAVGGLTPWQIPEAAYGTQRLYRGKYEGPAGNGGFRLTLRLVSGDRFQVRAVDPLGRGLWSLDARNGQALWIDHRNKIFCRLGDRLNVADAPLGDLPVTSFPILLLGRVPEPPRPTDVIKEGQAVFEGAEGRTWRVLLDQGQVRSWTLSRRGVPEAWYRFDGKDSLLSDRARGIQLRWREVVAEALVGELEILMPPEKYRLRECGDVTLPIETEDEDSLPFGPREDPAAG